MSRRSYRSAIDSLLVPLGFERNGRDWIRRRDGFEDLVSMQVSSYRGATANFATIDLISEVIFFEAIPRGSPGIKYPIYGRISDLMGPNTLDLWWRPGENGPEEMSQAIRTFALPFFDKTRDLEFQALRFGRADNGKFGSAPQQLYLAITLYRMGEKAEACRAMASPPRNLSPSWMVQVEALRRRLGCGSGA